MGIPAHDVIVPGTLRLESELAARAEDQSVEEYISSLCLTLHDGHVEAGMMREEMEQRYGAVGLDVLAAVMRAVESPESDLGGNGIKIIIFEDAIECIYDRTTPEDLDALKSALSWLCLLKRTPIANQMSISRGTWDGSTFRLLPLGPVDWSRSCWRKMFNCGIVASFDDSIPCRPLLKTVPYVMFLFSGVTQPLQVDEGLILHGSYSAMVPIAKQPDGSILWHFEKEARGSTLRVIDVECLKGKWYQTLYLGSLITAPVYIGWSAEGELLLGTDQHSHSTAWACSHAKSQPWLSIKLNIGFADYTIIRPRPTNYIRMLWHTPRYPWILYDASTKRAWPVPESCLLLYLVSIYSRDHNGKQFPPAGTPSGGLNARDFLPDNGGYVIWDMGGHKLTVKNMVSLYAANLDRLVPQAPRGGCISGYQLMDIVRDSKTLFRPETNTLRPRANWTVLLETIPCLIGANMGEVITGTRSKASNSPCNHLTTGRNFLAATIPTINNSGFWQVPGGVWMPSAEAFAKCDHDEAFGEDCWRSPKYSQS